MRFSGPAFSCIGVETFFDSGTGMRTASCINYWRNTFLRKSGSTTHLAMLLCPWELPLGIRVCVYVCVLCLFVLFRLCVLACLQWARQTKSAFRTMMMMRVPPSAPIPASAPDFLSISRWAAGATYIVCLCRASSSLDGWLIEFEIYALSAAGGFVILSLLARTRGLYALHTVYSCMYLLLTPWPTRLDFAENGKKKENTL